MADAEKKSEPKLISLLNKGKRHFDGLDAAGKPRRHSPGEVHSYSPEGAKLLEGYKELADISKLPGTIDAAKLESDNKSLNDENARLKAELAALGDKKDDGKKDKKDADKLKP